MHTAGGQGLTTSSLDRQGRTEFCLNRDGTYTHRTRNDKQEYLDKQEGRGESEAQRGGPAALGLEFNEIVILRLYTYIGLV